VDGKPVLYVRDESGKEYDGTNAGQFIIVNCSDVLFNDISLSDTTAAFYILACDSSTFSNISIQRCEYSWRVFQSDDLLIRDLLIQESGSEGLKFTHTNNSDLQDIVSKNNEWGGITLEESNGNSLTRCTSTNNSHGIALWTTINSNVQDCLIFDNRWNGIDISRSHSATIIDSTISNNDGLGLVGSGISVGDCTLTNISRNIIENNGNRGIHVGNSEETTISSCTFIGNGRGISTEKSSYIEIPDCTFTGHSRMALNIEESTSHLTMSHCSITENELGIQMDNEMDHITISNCEISNNGGTGILIDRDPTHVTSSNSTIAVNNGRGIDLHGSKDITISYCDIKWNGDESIWLKARNITVSHCTIVGEGVYVHDDKYDDFQLSIDDTTVNRKPLLFLANDSGKDFDDFDAGQIIMVDCDHIDFSGIKIENIVIGIYMMRCNNNTFANITITGCYNGVRSYESSDNQFDHCEIKHTEVYGVYLKYSNSNSFSDCVVTNCMDAFSFEYCDNNIITRTIIARTTSNGIKIRWCNDNEITYCSFVFNEGVGLRVEDSDDNVLSNSTIRSEDGIGIYIYRSDSNTFTDSTFIGNRINARDLSTNQWGDGNQYDDFDEPSEGAYDNDTNWIIDDPYIIPDGNNQDDHPKKANGDILSPYADAGPDQMVEIGTTVSLNGSNSVDNIGITDYWWEFDDGGTIDLNGPVITHTFNSLGDYQITLTVGDGVDFTDTDTMWVHVVDEIPDNFPPTANAGPDQNVIAGTAVTFDGSGSMDDVGITSYTWEFQDSGLQTLSGVFPSHLFTTADNYEVTLTVEDAAGNSHSDTMWVFVTDPVVEDTEDPVADAGPDQTVVQGNWVTFDGSGSSDNVGIMKLTWTFQDIGPQTLIGLSPSYTFIIVGYYDVTLTVKDAAGNLDTDIMKIKVIDASQTGNVSGIVFDDKGELVEGATVEIVGTGLTMETDGQGNFSFTNVPAGTFTLNASKGDISGSKEITVEAGETKTVTVTIQEGGSDVEGNGDGGGSGLMIAILIIVAVMIIVVILKKDLLFGMVSSSENPQIDPKSEHSEEREDIKEKDESPK